MDEQLMDKSTILKMLEDRARGEKTRVLFDLLMDTVGASFEMKQHEVFEKIKEVIEAEQKAIGMMMPKVEQMPSPGFQETVKEVKRQRRGSVDIHPNEDKVGGLFDE